VVSSPPSVEQVLPLQLSLEPGQSIRNQAGLMSILRTTRPSAS
jgi:hypothetical protein